MKIQIEPSKLSGSLTAISSKSFAHRQIVCALMADKDTKIEINGFSDDIICTLQCVKALGGNYRKTDTGVIISPARQKLDNVLLDCGESGTTARIMIPISAALANSAVIDGRGRLPQRPFAEMTNALRDNGINISSDTLPMSVSGNLKCGDFYISGDISSQYITGLMLALNNINGVSRIFLTSPLRSKKYVHITIDVIKSFGGVINTTDYGYEIIGKGYKSPENIVAEGDWSNSAFWIVMNKLGSKININNINPESLQGDKKIIEVLDQTEIDVDEIPDLFPVLAVLAAGRNGTTRLYNAGRLRHKESDRIESVTQMLISLGAKVESGEDYLKIFGNGTLNGGHVNSYNDHRIVMASAIASAICKDNIIIDGFEAVNKSYPSFFDEFNRLGGKAYVI